MAATNAVISSKVQGSSASVQLGAGAGAGRCLTRRVIQQAVARAGTPKASPEYFTPSGGVVPGIAPIARGLTPFAFSGQLL